MSVEPVRVVKYPIVVDKVGTRIEDLTNRDECTVWLVISELDPTIELVVIVDPIKEVKYPVVVDIIGTVTEDRTNSDD